MGAPSTPVHLAEAASVVTAPTSFDRAQPAATDNSPHQASLPPVTQVTEEIRDFPRGNDHRSTYKPEAAVQPTTPSPLGVPADVALPAWLNPGGADGGADRVAQSRAANVEIASMAKLYLTEGPEAIAAVAMKNYTPIEQAEIINEGEGTRAANLDALDLSGTHYTALMLEDDEETWLS